MLHPYDCPVKTNHMVEVLNATFLTLSLSIFWQFCSLSATFILTARGIVESQAYQFSKNHFFSTFSFNYV